jgi:hypothetical protein
MLMPIDGKKPEGNGQEGSRQQGRSASRSRTFTQIRMLDSVGSGVAKRRREFMAHDPLPEYSSNTAELVYGVGAPGKIKRISEVERSLRCGCTCPGCGAALVAKKR